MTRNPDVDAWLSGYENPQRENVALVRDLVLAVDDRITEAIKWQAPTFMFQGNIASFYPKATAHVSLMFHRGATIPGDHRLLEGEGETSRVARFADADDIRARADELRAVVQAWIADHGG